MSKHFSSLKNDSDFPLIEYQQKNKAFQLGTFIFYSKDTHKEKAVSNNSLPKLFQLNRRGVVKFSGHQENYFQSIEIDFTSMKNIHYCLKSIFLLYFLNKN